MIRGKKHKIVLAIAAILIWLLPQKVLGEDEEIKSQLSYISKIVGVVESSMIKIEGDVRFVKRQAEKTISEKKISARRLNSLEKKIDSIDGLLNEITGDIAKLTINLKRVKKNLEVGIRGSCNSSRLCRSKK